MKTVCHDRAWEEDGEIKCEYNGSILTYQKKDVLRIEKIKIDDEDNTDEDDGKSNITDVSKDNDNDNTIDNKFINKLTTTTTKIRK